MIYKAFAEQVKHEFWYLPTEYGFSVTETIHEGERFGKALVQFQSPTTIVIMQRDWRDIFSHIGPTTEPEIGWLSIDVLVNFITRGKDKLLTEGYQQSPYTPEGMAERIGRYSIALHKYCDRFLRGDFSQWFEIQKWFLKQMEDEYRSVTGLEFPQNQRYVLYIKQKAKEQR